MQAGGRAGKTPTCTCRSKKRANTLMKTIAKKFRLSTLAGNCRSKSVLFSQEIQTGDGSHSAAVPGSGQAETPEAFSKARRIGEEIHVCGRLQHCGVALLFQRSEDRSLPSEYKTGGKGLTIAYSLSDCNLGRLLVGCNF